MPSPTTTINPERYHFPQQKVLLDNKPYSHELLRSVLENISGASPPFTGYLEFAGQAGSLHFLFFFNGAPYAAGRFEHSKPAGYSIEELGRLVAKSAEGAMAITLCATDPVLLKSMLLFLQEEPAIKAPPSLLDFEYIVRQIGEIGTNALIALCRDTTINFFFFKQGKGALVYYADQAFERPKDMTIDEEMLLYAYQPDGKVQAYIFRDVITTMSEDSTPLDKDSLYKLLTVGYLKDRRGGNKEASSMPEGTQQNRRRGDDKVAPAAATEGVEVLAKHLQSKPKAPSVLLSVESGPLKGEHFIVTLPCTIGRKDCDLILDDHCISRRHAELKVIDNKLVIEDLKSKNGTKVNGASVTTKKLIPNDLISIGPTDLRVSRA